jgi:glycosyltransferase involved in cell wall biosynthesis
VDKAEGGLRSAPRLASALPLTRDSRAVAYLPYASVIVPAYNAEDTVEACMESLLRLHYPSDRVELIFVDNGSTDATPDILRGRADVLRVVHERRRGPAAARNAGLAFARGEAVAFTDADCVVDEDWLRSILAPLEGQPTRVVGGRILATRPCNWIERFGERIHDHRSSIEVLHPPYVITMNWAMRRSNLGGPRSFDESLRRCSDVDLAYRLFEAGYSFLFQPTALVYHRNERSLRGLFREGFQHGFYSVEARRKHRELLEACGHRGVSWGAYTRVVSSLINAIRGRDVAASVCESIFLSGKALGRVTGSLRFRHLGL